MMDDSESWIRPGQQPIRRVVGKRVSPPPGQLPSAADRAAMDSLNRFCTYAPKGVISYSTHEDMNKDRERWAVQAVVTRQLERG